MDSSQWNQTIKDGLREVALASMDALQNWFFWTWKIGPNASNNTVMAPLWSYQLGLENDWMPTDPRSATGVCQSLSAPTSSFDGTYSAWQTGAPGASSLDPSVVQSFSAWPPTDLAGITGDIAFIYTYTSTATIETLPADTFTAAPKGFSTGNGWVDPSDTASDVIEVAGCSYPDAWGAVGAPMPTTLCSDTPGAVATGTVITTGLPESSGSPVKMARRSAITPPPSL